MEEQRSDDLRIKVRFAHLSNVEQFVPEGDELALAMHLTGRCKLDWDCGRESFSAHPLGHALTLIPAGRSGTFRVTGESEVVKLFISRQHLADLFPNKTPDIADMRTRPTFLDDLLAELVLALFRHSDKGNQPSRIYRESLEHTLLTHTFYRYGGLHVPAVRIRPIYKLSPSQSRSLIDYMRENLQTDVGLRDLARHVGISVSHFSMQFRNRFGTTPSRYLMSMRLDCAREQLERSDLPICEIAVRCGFSSASHFAETFRRTYGSAPSVYRTTKRV